jgi:hypothetical protein
MVTTQALADEIFCYVVAKVYVKQSAFVRTSNVPPSDWFLSYVTTVFQLQWLCGLGIEEKLKMKGG